MAWAFLLLIASFALLLTGAVLFTNAIEWAGARLNLGAGAVGSILAALATALPESVIPVVAIISGESSGDVAVGAIIGAPFLLATLALALVAACVFGFRRRREHGRELSLDRGATRRDLTVFLPFFAVALVLGLMGPQWLHYVAAAVFLTAYVLYARRVIASGGGADTDEELAPLYFDPTKRDDPHNREVVLQVLAALAAIIGGAELFVTEVESIATAYGVAALVLALLLAPLATELPEQINSVLWVRRGKDPLALGNITGAMVFQSMLPVSVGFIFLPWKLQGAAAVAACCALGGAALALLLVQLRARFSAFPALAWIALYAGTLGYVISTA